MTGPELDRLIDGALSGYAGEPAPGLEERVLRRVRRSPLRWWPVAAAVAAAVLMVWLPLPTVHAPAPVMPAKAAPLVTKAPTKAPSSTKALAAVPRVLGARAAPLAAKFMSAPLSPEERRLALFAQTAPALAQQALLDAPQRMSEPLSIAPIVIEALSTTPAGVE